MRSGNVDLLRSFGVGLVGALTKCVRFKESCSSLMQSETSFRSPMRMTSESLKLFKVSEREEMDLLWKTVVCSSQQEESEYPWMYSLLTVSTSNCAALGADCHMELQSLDFT